MTTLLTERFSQALHMAFAWHGAQRRKGSGTPYIAHLIGVASLVLEAGGSEEEAIAALLHDAIEDGDPATVRPAIAETFGAEVLAIVEGCTDSDVQPKPPWRERKERYLAHLREAPPSVRLVAAADKLYNARTVLADYRAIGEALWPRFTGGREGSLWYYRALADALLTAERNALTEELARVVAELERVAEI